MDVWVDRTTTVFENGSDRPIMSILSLLQLAVIVNGENYRTFQQVDFEVIQGVPSVLWLISCYWPVISAHNVKNNAKPRLTRAPTTARDSSSKDRSLIHKAKCFAIINFIYLLILLLLLFYRTENSFSFSVCVFSARINIKAVGLCLTSLRCVWLVVAVVHLSIEISIWTCSRNSQSLGPAASGQING